MKPLNIDADRAVLEACKAELLEVLKRHDCCGAFTIQRQAAYRVGEHLTASHSALRDDGDKHRLDVDTDDREEFARRVSSTLSIFKALGDGQEQSAANLRGMHDSLMEFLTSIGVNARNKGPIGGGFKH